MGYYLIKQFFTTQITIAFYIWVRNNSRMNVLILRVDSRRQKNYLNCSTKLTFLIEYFGENLPRPQRMVAELQLSPKYFDQKCWMLLNSLNIPYDVYYQHVK